MERRWFNSAAFSAIRWWIWTKSIQNTCHKSIKSQRVFIGWVIMVNYLAHLCCIVLSYFVKERDSGCFVDRKLFSFFLLWIKASMSHCVQESRSPPPLVMTVVQPLIDFLITLYYLAEDKDETMTKAQWPWMAKAQNTFEVCKIDSLPSTRAPFNATGWITWHSAAYVMY